MNPEHHTLQFDSLCTHLRRDEQDWYKKNLLSITRDGVGWGKNIPQILPECDITLSFDKIKNKKKNEWRQIVGHDEAEIIECV